jgi:hypothetical protein
VSSKKKKNVPSVETKKPESVEKTPDVAQTTPNSAVDTGKPEEKAVQTSPEPQFVSIDDIWSKVDPKKLQTAEDLGIPIGPIFVYLKGLENRDKLREAQIQIMGEAIQKGMPTEDGIADKMFARLKEEREKTIAIQKTQEQPAQNQPQQQQSREGSPEAAILKEIFGGGGSGRNPVTEKMNKLTDAILDKAIEGVTNPRVSKFEEFFEEELAKAKAKTMARAVTEGTGA